jgi:hypothetical protein
LEQVHDSFADRAPGSLEQLLEVDRVVFEKAIDVGITGINAMVEEAFTNEGTIGAPGEFQHAGGGGKVEDFMECAFESLHPSAAAADESAIDIEQEESYHGKKLPLAGERTSIFRWKGS